MLGHSLQGTGLTIDGVELNPTWAQMARPYYRDVWASTIEAAPLPEKAYKLIVCADVLEHTADPGAVLQRLRRAGTDDAVFIVSVPNVAHLAVRLMLLLGRFPKMERGPLDRTHLHFFTRETARDMVESAGLTVRRITCTGVPLDEIWKSGEGGLLYKAAVKAQHVALAVAAAAVRLPVDPGGAGVRHPGARPAARALFATAAAAVGGAIQFHDGEYRQGTGGAAAIALITFAIVAAAGRDGREGREFKPHPPSPGPPAPPDEGGGEGVFLHAQKGQRRPSTANPHQRVPEDPHPSPLPEYRGGSPPRLPANSAFGVLLGILLATQFTLLLTHRPDSREHAYLLPGGPASLGYYRAGLAAAAGADRLRHLRRATKRCRPRLARLWFPATLAVFAALGGAALSWTTRPHSDVDPHIDVFVFQQQGSRALLHGRNPYAIDDYPDIYHSGTIDPATGQTRQEVYGPGMSDGRTLRFGFPYLPMSLYLATIGYAVAGDYRVAQLAALILAAVLLYAARPGATSALAAVLLLFTPRAFFVLISGWTEPLLVLWLAAAVYCACRRPPLLPVALGLLLATKQYMALALPLTILLVPRGDGRRGGDGVANPAPAVAGLVQAAARRRPGGRGGNAAAGAVGLEAVLFLGRDGAAVRPVPLGRPELPDLARLRPRPAVGADDGAAARPSRRRSRRRCASGAPRARRPGSPGRSDWSCWCSSPSASRPSPTTTSS